MQKTPKNSKRNSKKLQKKIHKKSKEIPKNFSNIPNFENIQFPKSHLGAENPFGLVFLQYG